jgi:hypothetical protein
VIQPLYYYRLTERNESTQSFKDLQINVHSSVICGGLNLETAQMSTNK